jgi:hypothetical protein
VLSPYLKKYVAPKKTTLKNINDFFWKRFDNENVNNDRKNQ